MQIIMQQSECVISTHLQYLQIEQKICIAYSLLNIRSEFLSQGHRSDISMTDSCYGARVVISESEIATKKRVL